MKNVAKPSIIGKRWKIEVYFSHSLIFFSYKHGTKDFRKKGSLQELFASFKAIKKTTLV